MVDETFHKYLKIKQLGDLENKDIFLFDNDDIVIEEKVDGANFRFMITKNGKLMFGSHNRELGEKDENYKFWKRSIDFIKEKIGNESFLNNPKFHNKIFYGESMKKHSLDYNWEKIPTFLGFDILDLTTNKFISNKNEYFNELGLPVVPHIMTCKANKIKDINDAHVPVSAYAPLSTPQQKAEGCVFKNYDKQLFAKYVREQFKEVNRRAFGGSKKWATNDTEKIIAMYCTNARIDKIIYKLHDNGMDLGMMMMKKLPTKLWNDIIEEHGGDILRTKFKLDLGLLRKDISHRCVAVLKQVIVNSAL